MITIHEKTAQNFNTLGLGTLLPGSCVVTEEVNGAYELKMEHPYDSGDKWKRVERGRIIYASTPTKMQPFRIYNVKPDMNGIVVNARHIFYDLLDNQCSEISFNGTAGGALVALQEAFAFPMPFAFNTDISASGALETGKMNPVQVLLSDDDETTSFVKGFGGELLRDGFNVSLKDAIGQDRDVAIRYGKNLAVLDVTEDEADVKTRIMCYGSDGSATVDSPYINEYVYPKIHTLEDKEKTVAELKTEAQALFDGGADIPLVNIKVDFVVLADTVEYADYAPLEEVFLGDIVTIINQKMNFAKKARVISYEWDCLLEKYNEVELGDFMPTLASSVTSGVRSGSLASSAAVTSSAVAALLNSHMNNFNNPHRVTAAQTGGSSGGSAETDADAVLELLAEHEADKENPHGVTAKQVGTYTADEIDNKFENFSGGSGSGFLSGKDSPTSALGSDGDVYLQIPGETEYTELEYMTATGTQFINTEFKPNNNTRIVMDICVSLNGSTGCLFGGRYQYAQDDFSFWGNNADGGLTNYGNKSNSISFSVDGWHRIDKNKNITMVDGIVLDVATENTFQSDYNLYLMAAMEYTGVDGRNVKGDFKASKVYDNGVLIRDYISVIDKNGVVCAYEKVEGKYYYNAGSGAFVAGPVAIPRGSLWLKQNGTWTQVLKGAA